jgi:ATPase subunit of ABC transporter with duplicated ATPase domains
MRIQLDAVSAFYGASPVLADVSTAVGKRSRLGLVGPNGVGKTTLLKLLAGLREPDEGRVVRIPEELSVGYLPQEPDAESDETLGAYLARRTGVAAAQVELEAASSALATGSEGGGDGGERYAAALDRLLALGGGDLEPRSRVVCADLGLGVGFEHPMVGLSGGERARAALAAILLSRFDVLLLDEPTNDLDFDGLERLERFALEQRGGLVVVSHDREFLDRVATRILEIEPGSHRVREWPGGWSEYEAARGVALRLQYKRFDQAQEERQRLQELLAARREQARAGGAMADRRGTQALRSKVRQAERLLDQVDGPVKPFEPWQLQLTLTGAPRAGDTVVALRSAVGQRGSFSLGPVDLHVAPGERLAITGRNGTGKTTLLRMLSGALPLASGSRDVGQATTVGEIGQERSAFIGREPLLARFVERAGLDTEHARTLLAKFGLGAAHVDRLCDVLSPGERTRAHLAELQVRPVNLLLLDEPTNHLDLEAVEQLELALAGYEGALVVVSHDRRFLESIAPERELALD